MLLKKASFKDNFIIIVFDAEEIGLYRSKYFVNKYIEQDTNEWNYMINLDILERLNHGNLCIINGTGTSPQLPETLKSTESKILE